MDWHRSMKQTPRYYLVNQNSWRDLEPLDTVVGCKTTRDIESELRESAQLTFDGQLVGEFWVRCYLDCEQDGRVERVPIGTWLVQTPTRKMDGRVSEVNAVAYSPLHVLREERVPVLWHAPKGSTCVDMARQVCERFGVAPVIASKANIRLDRHYIAPNESTALDVARTLAAAAGMEVGVDAMGNVTITPYQSPEALLPTWTFRDDEKSIIEPDVDEELDWYQIPNVCEVITGTTIGRAVNDDPSNILSTVSRGRRVVLRIENPDELKSGATQELADRVAAKRRSAACSMERTLNIVHGICPLKLGECAEVDWRAMDLRMLGRVTRQELDMSTGVSIRSTIKTESGRWGVQ